VAIASVTIITKFIVHRQAKEPARGPSRDTAAVTLGSALLILIIDGVCDNFRRRSNQSAVDYPRTAAARALARSTRSQLTPGSSRPKCP
jgi:hypothetical protein